MSDVTGRTGSRAVVYTETGGPQVLQLSERPVPEPGPGEVRVRVHRSGVNPTDWKSRSGPEPGRPVEPPQVPDQDGSGVVEAVGTGVDAALLGLRVWLWESAYQRPHGTAADHTLALAERVVPLPEAASFDLGACLGVPFVTAHRCLTVTELGPTRLGPGALRGRVVLVAGGAGAVGNAAIQLARWSDATVLATVSSPAKAQLATAAGAEFVLDYRRQDVVAEIARISPRGVDTIVEVAAADNVGIDTEVLAPNGSVAVYAGTPESRLTIPVRSAMGPNARWQFVLLYSAPALAKAAAVEDVRAAVREGAVRVGREAGLPLHHYPLERTAEAHAAVADGAVGKVLIDVVGRAAG